MKVCFYSHLVSLFLCWEEKFSPLRCCRLQQKSLWKKGLLKLLVSIWISHDHVWHSESLIIITPQTALTLYTIALRMLNHLGDFLFCVLNSKHTHVIVCFFSLSEQKSPCTDWQEAKRLERHAFSIPVESKMSQNRLLYQTNCCQIAWWLPVNVYKADIHEYSSGVFF